MQSDGGLAPMDAFSGHRAILSGPAGGVVGYSATSFDAATRQPVIGFDMGGTSTDVSRYDGSYTHVFETTTGEREKKEEGDGRRAVRLKVVVCVWRGQRVSRSSRRSWTSARWRRGAGAGCSSATASSSSGPRAREPTRGPSATGRGVMGAWKGREGAWWWEGEPQQGWSHGRRKPRIANTAHASYDALTLLWCDACVCAGRVVCWR